MKHLIAIALLCLLLAPCIGQDLIITTDGQHIPCKVLELYPLAIRYQVEDGMIQVFHTKDIAAVQYRTGITITFYNKTNAKRSSSLLYNQKFAGQPAFQQLQIPKGRVVVSTILDGQSFLQVLDTSLSSTPSPIYRCDCLRKKIEPTKELEINNNRVECSQPDFGFYLVVNSSRFAQLEQLLWDAYLYEYVIDFPFRLSFSKDGVRYPYSYLLELEHDYQLKTIYTLNDGRKVAEITFKTQSNSVFITCSCECPKLGPCTLKRQGERQLLCTPVSTCMPTVDECHGCSFKHILAKTFKDQIKGSEVINDY